MTNDKLHYFDQVIGMTFSHLNNGVNKDKNSIHLTNLDIENDSCLCVMEIAKIASQCYGYHITVELPFFKYLKYCWKHKGWKTFKRKRKTIGMPFDVADYIVKVEVETNYPNLFKEIYETYYA